MTLARHLKPEYKLGLKYLEESDGLTVRSLQSMLGIARRSVQEYISLWKAEQKIYIARWHRNFGSGGKLSPVWAIGNRRNAPRPPRLTKAQIAARWREKNRATSQVQRRAKRGTLNPFQQLLLAQHDANQSRPSA